MTGHHIIMLWYATNLYRRHIYELVKKTSRFTSDLSIYKYFTINKLTNKPVQSKYGPAQQACVSLDLITSSGYFYTKTLIDVPVGLVVSEPDL